MCFAVSFGSMRETSASLASSVLLLVRLDLPSLVHPFCTVALYPLYEPYIS